MVFTEYHIFLCSITDETISLQLSALLYLITIKNKAEFNLQMQQNSD